MNDECNDIDCDIGQNPLFTDDDYYEQLHLIEEDDEDQIIGDE